MAGVKVLEAKVTNNVYAEIQERIRLGLFASESEVVERALRKAFAEEAREFLRNFIKSKKISRTSLLSAWKKVRA